MWGPFPVDINYKSVVMDKNCGELHDDVSVVGVSEWYIYIYIYSIHLYGHSKL